MPGVVRRIPDGLLADADSTPTECALLHPYPGTMPAYLASRLVDRFSSPESLVFDPFCGIGTTVVEALRLGRTAVGADLLPLAVETTNVAATLPTVSGLEDSWNEVRGRASASIFLDESRRAIAENSTPGIRALHRWVHPRTFEDVVGLKEAIEDIGNVAAKRVFRLVLAASLPSLSKRRSRGVLHWGWIADNVVPDPADLVATDAISEVSRRLGRLFAFMRAVNRGSGLASTDVAFESDWTRPSCYRHVLPTGVDLLLTSPPYPYSIDYSLSTRLSGYLLDLPFDKPRQHEIGARFKRKRKDRGREYSTEISGALAALGGTVRRGGFVVLVLPDPEEYASVVPLDAQEWASFVLGSLGPTWRLEEWGIRSYAARRVVPSSRPQRHDRVLALRRVGG